MSDNTDLHLHTYYSDGTLSPGEVVEWAKEKGLTTIAITDHDGVGGMLEGIEAGKKLGIKVIPGIEISAQNQDGIGLHILGYDINLHYKPLIDACDSMRQKRKIRNAQLMKALNNLGYSLNWEDLNLKPGQDYIGKPHFAIALVKKGYVHSPKEAFAHNGVFGAKEIRRIKKEKVPAQVAIDLITGAGGMAVLAHPAKISHLGERGTQGFYDRLDTLLDQLKAMGLGGLECVYPEHSDEETIQFTIMAHRHGLKVTGGSDYHGPELDPAFVD
jgi:3',5'-nucleoside bisphosphate phosphatase